MMVGHESQRRYFERSLASGRLHQAYLFDGPRGMGKATFARTLAPSLMGGAQASSLLASGAHPDFMEIRIEQNPNTGKPFRDIRREQIEKLLVFMTQHAALSDRKVILIDAADDLNPSAANNLLKWLEEPRPKTCIMLIAHRVDRLLPTLRSRCARLRFPPLDRDTFGQFAALHDLEEVGSGTDLFGLSGGVPGKALALTDKKVREVSQGIGVLVQDRFQADLLKLCQSAPSLLPSKDLEGLATGLRVLRHGLRTLAGKGTAKDQAYLAARAYALTHNREAQAKALNLDPVQVFTALLLDLQGLSREGRGHGP